MFGYKCDKCGKGTVRAKKVRNYATRIDGVPFAVENAMIGVCDQCEAKYFNARETKRWREAFFQEQMKTGRILAATDISNLRGEMRISVADFARLIGCSRQALYLWESTNRAVPQSRMADLLIRLVRESFRVGPVNVVEFLRASLKAAGMNDPDCFDKPSSGVEQKAAAACSAVTLPHFEASDKFDLLFAIPNEHADFSPRLGMVA